MQALFEQVPESDFNISLGTEHASIVEKMRNGSIDPLGNLCDMTVGVKPYQTGKGTPKQTREVVEKRIFDATSRKNKTYHQYLMGRDIDRYLIAPLEERWLSYGEWLAEPRPAAPFFEPKRIVVRQTGDSIIAALEEEQRLTLNNIHNLRLVHQPPTYESLLTILNSRLITYFHQQVVPEADRVFAEVKIVDVEKLPIRHIVFTTPPEERAQLLDEGKRLYERCQLEGDNDHVLKFIDHELAQTPERADVVHDLLAFLAEQMIEMNKQKQAEVKSFLTWFERAIGAELDDLNNKSKLKAYHEHDFETLLAILKQNRRKLTVNLHTRTVQDVIERERSASIAKLSPLKAKIAATDRLIDLIVYRLYRLTEEEIAVVEGK
jgi:TaqI-like C-terminal specificity domain